MIHDLLAAGSDSTSNTTGKMKIKSLTYNSHAWLSSTVFQGFVLLYLINHPEVQKKMQVELDDVCGENLPSLDDRSR